MQGFGKKPLTYTLCCVPLHLSGSALLDTNAYFVVPKEGSNNRHTQPLNCSSMQFPHIASASWATRFGAWHSQRKVSNFPSSQEDTGMCGSALIVIIFRGRISADSDVRIILLYISIITLKLIHY